MGGYVKVLKRCVTCGRPVKTVTPSGTSVRNTDDHGHCDRCVGYGKCPVPVGQLVVWNEMAR